MRMKAFDGGELDVTLGYETIINKGDSSVDVLGTRKGCRERKVDTSIGHRITNVDGPLRERQKCTPG